MQSKPFKELFAIPLRNGLTKPKAVRGTGTKMVNMGELFANPRITDVSMDRVPLNQAERNSSLLTSGDLLFARQSLVLSGAGKCSIFVNDDEEVCFESHVIRCRLNRELADPDFYFYFFSSSAGRRLVESIVEQGAGASGIRGSDLAELVVPWVIPDIQSQVATVLRNLDEKIVINRRINQTLEAMAQAIFQSWFVDFDPVKAKIAAIQQGRDPLRAAMSAISGKPDAELDLLPPELYEQLAATATLFPEEMEESELGEIPKGWGFKSVADIAQLASGKIDVSSLTEDIYISTENMLESRAGVTRAASLPSVATVPCFKVGQILVSNIRPYFKKIWMARFDGGRSPDVLAFESADPQWAEFLYNLMYQDAFFEFMTRTAKGAKMPRGDKDAIMGWRFPCPDQLLMAFFSEKVRPHYACIESLVSQSKSLTELRDVLLPKLLSGELSVAEAMAEAEA